MAIYVYRGGTRGGPYTRGQVTAGMSAGTFLPIDMAWQDGAAGLVPINSLLTAQYEYHCDSCGSKAAPGMFRRISTGGWIFFFILLLLCFPLSLFGFLIKEEYSVCPSCGFQKTLN